MCDTVIAIIKFVLYQSSKWYRIYQENFSRFLKMTRTGCIAKLKIEYTESDDFDVFYFVRFVQQKTI